jgi:aspartate/methionine/tyrosine aminotransferase
MHFIDALVSRNVHEASVSAIKEMAMRSARVPGAASLAWGLPSFATPEYIREGVIRRLREDPDAGKYTLPDGLPELRELAARRHEQKTGVAVSADDNILVSAGNMQGLNTLFHTMMDPGDEIILTDPCFASHIQQIRLFNGTPVFWRLDECRNWRLDVEALPRLINERTQAIVLVSPSNPTGRIFSEAELRAVGDIAREHDILLFIDDPYSDFVYDHADDYFNLASVESLHEHLVYGYTFSKGYAMSGWRLAYQVMPARLKRQALKVHDATMICAPRVSQLAGIVALSEPTDHVSEFTAQLMARRDLVCERLDRLAGVFSYQPPEGAYYVFPRIEVEHTDSWSFAVELLEHAAVTVTPGSAFGPAGEHHVRMAYCVDEGTINRAFDRMEEYFL